MNIYPGKGRISATQTEISYLLASLKNFELKLGLQLFKYMCIICKNANTSCQLSVDNLPFLWQKSGRWSKYKFVFLDILKDEMEYAKLSKI